MHAYWELRCARSCEHFSRVASCTDKTIPTRGVTTEVRQLVDLSMFSFFGDVKPSFSCRPCRQSRRPQKHGTGSWVSFLRLQKSSCRLGATIVLSIVQSLQPCNHAGQSCCKPQQELINNRGHRLFVVFSNRSCSGASPIVVVNYGALTPSF